MDRIPLRRRQLLLYLGLSVAGISAATACKRSPQIGETTPSASPALPLAKGSEPAIAAAPVGKPLPDFQGISQWLNSAPLKVSDLKGSVVLVQIWTLGCINCQRTLPYITKWHQQYAAQGLKIVGIHTPEFAFERDINNIKRAIQHHKIAYPVGVDSNFKTWKAYENEYWPHLFLADRQGFLRYDHIGEGAYAETEQMIRQLLG